MMKTKTFSYRGKSIYGTEFAFDTPMDAQFITVTTFETNGKFYSRVIGMHQTSADAEETLMAMRTNQTFIDHGAMSEIVTLTKVGYIYE